MLIQQNQQILITSLIKNAVSQHKILRVRAQKQISTLWNKDPQKFATLIIQALRLSGFQESAVLRRLLFNCYLNSSKRYKCFLNLPPHKENFQLILMTLESNQQFIQYYWNMTVSRSQTIQSGYSDYYNYVQLWLEIIKQNKFIMKQTYQTLMLQILRINEDLIQLFSHSVQIENIQKSIKIGCRKNQKQSEKQRNLIKLKFKILRKGIKYINYRNDQIHYLLSYFSNVFLLDFLKLVNLLFQIGFIKQTITIKNILLSQIPQTLLNEKQFICWLKIYCKVESCHPQEIDYFINLLKLKIDQDNEQVICKEIHNLSKQSQQLIVQKLIQQQNFIIDKIHVVILVQFKQILLMDKLKLLRLQQRLLKIFYTTNYYANFLMQQKKLVLELYVNYSRYILIQKVDSAIKTLKQNLIKQIWIINKQLLLDQGLIFQDDEIMIQLIKVLSNGGLLFQQTEKHILQKVYAAISPEKGVNFIKSYKNKYFQIDSTNSLFISLIKTILNKIKKPNQVQQLLTYLYEDFTINPTSEYIYEIASEIKINCLDEMLIKIFCQRQTNHKQQNQCSKPILQFLRKIIENVQTESDIMANIIKYAIRSMFSNVQQIIYSSIELILKIIIEKKIVTKEIILHALKFCDLYNLYQSYGICILSVGVYFKPFDVKDWLQKQRKYKRLVQKLKKFQEVNISYNKQFFYKLYALGSISFLQNYNIDIQNTVIWQKTMELIKIFVEKGTQKSIEPQRQLLIQSDLNDSSDESQNNEVLNQMQEQIQTIQLNYYEVSSINKIDIIKIIKEKWKKITEKYPKLLFPYKKFEGISKQNTWTYRKILKIDKEMFI